MTITCTKCGKDIPISKMYGANGHFVNCKGVR